MRAVLLMPGDKSDIFWINSDLHMLHCTWDDINTFFPWPGSDPASWPGHVENLGGPFASAPAAVALGTDRLEVFAVGVDDVLYQKSYSTQADAMGNHWSPEWENLGGVLTSTPVVVSPTPDRVDIFALGPDQGMLHRTRTGTAWSAWEELGGCFTSAPVVLPASPDTFDIFARGGDYLIYQAQLSASGHSDWAALGGGLLREPIAASAPAAVRMHGELYVFVVANDQAIWFTWFDGKLWKPWYSLGGTFVSEPVAIALFPQNPVLPLSHRIDVFGVHPGESSNQLWHKWLDNQGWHDWRPENDGQRLTPVGLFTTPSFACAPGIALRDRPPNFHSPPPAHFRVVRPDDDGTIHLAEFDGTTWTGWELGPPYRLPSTYTFSLDWVHVDEMMSRGPGTIVGFDTDVASATLATGAWPPQSRSHKIGDHIGPGDHQLFQLEFTITVELCEPAILTWSIVNSGNSQAAKALLKATELTAGWGLKALGGDISSDIGGAILSAVLDSALSFAFGGCDGIVSVGALPYPNGRTLNQAVMHAPGHKLTGSTQYKPKTSNCNISDYTVKWSIQLAGYTRLP